MNLTGRSVTDVLGNLREIQRRAVANARAGSPRTIVVVEDYQEGTRLALWTEEEVVRDEGGFLRDVQGFDGRDWV